MILRRALNVALKFGTGDERLELVVKPPSDDERMLILETLDRGSLSQMAAATSALIVDWSGVTNEDGIAVTMKFDDGTGATRSRLDDLLGAMPLQLRGEVMIGILAFCGVRAERLGKLTEWLRDLAGGAFDPRPTSGSASTPPSG